MRCIKPRFTILVLLLICHLDPSAALKRTGRSLLARGNPKLKLATPDYTIYHSSDALQSAVQELVKKHANEVQLESLQMELNQYAAQVDVVTLNVEPDADKSKIRVLLDFGQHGREPITSEVALRLLEVLVGEKAYPGLEKEQLQQMLSEMLIKVIPMENVNGRRRVEAGELCERKNGRGVDTNRNWEVDWGKKESDYDPAEEFPGSSPFSEPEAELLRKLTAEFKPHLWINVHSGMEALLMPYDHRRGGPLPHAATIMTTLMQKVNQAHCHMRCVVGSGGGAVGYLAHGTATDYMYDTAHVPLAFTWEIYGDEGAHHDDCFRMFNPITREAFEAVVTDWTGAFISVLLELPEALRNITTPEFQKGEASLAVDQLPSSSVTELVSREDSARVHTSLQSTMGKLDRMSGATALKVVDDTEVPRWTKWPSSRSPLHTVARVAPFGMLFCAALVLLKRHRRIYWPRLWWWQRPSLHKISA